MDERSDIFEADGRATLFGHAAVPVKVTIRARSRSWRLGGALRRMAGLATLAPVVAIVPPHAPWALGALGVGALLARRRWHERFTLVSVAGPCPRCGAELSARPGRLRSPHPLPCEGCQHEVSLEVASETLEEHAAG